MLFDANEIKTKDELLIAFVKSISYSDSKNIDSVLTDFSEKKEPFINKLQTSMIEISNSPSFLSIVNEVIKSKNFNDEIYEKISKIVNTRLEELTPKMVKEIVQNMIKEHLSWLVLWGAVFGGLFGLIGMLIS